MHAHTKICFMFLILTLPGFHLKMPLLTQYEPVQVTLQTDQVNSLEQCWELGVSAGSVIWI